LANSQTELIENHHSTLVGQRHFHQQQDDLIRAVHDERVSVALHGAAADRHAQPRRVAHASAAAAIVERAGHQQLVVRRSGGFKSLRPVQCYGER
jgi:UDP-N-acetylmuramyl pentapeptide synthase